MFAFKAILILLSVPSAASYGFGLPISVPKFTLPPVIQLPTLKVNFAAQSAIDVSGILGASGSLSISAPVMSLDGKSVAVSFSIPNVESSSQCMIVLSKLLKNFGTIASLDSFSIGSPVVSLSGNSVSLSCSFPNIPSTAQFLNIVAEAMAEINAFVESGASLTVGTLSVDGTTVSLPCTCSKIELDHVMNIFSEINELVAIAGHGAFSISTPVVAADSASFSLSLPNTQANVQLISLVSAVLDIVGKIGASVNFALPNISLPTVSIPTINLPRIQIPTLHVNFNGNANIDASALLGASAHLSISGASLSIDGQSVSVAFTLPNTASAMGCLNSFSDVIASLSAAASFGGQVSIGLPKVSVDGYSISLPCSLPNIEASTNFLNIVSEVFAEINTLASLEGSIFVGDVSLNGASISLPCTFPVEFLAIFPQLVAHINQAFSLAGHAGASIGASIASGASVTVPVTLPNIQGNAEVMGAIAAALHTISATACGCVPSLPDVYLPEIQIPEIDVPSVQLLPIDPEIIVPSIEVPSIDVSETVPEVSLPEIQIPDVDVSLPTIDVDPSIELPSVELPGVCGTAELTNIFTNLMANINAFVELVIELGGSVALTVGEVSVNGASVSLPLTLPNVPELIEIVKHIIETVNACAGSQFNLSTDSSFSVDASVATLTITIPDASVVAQKILSIIANILREVNACAQLGQQINLSVGSSVSIEAASVSLPLTFSNIAGVQNIIADVIANINQIVGQASLTVGLPQVSVGGVVTLPVSFSCLPHVELPVIELPSFELPEVHGNIDGSLDFSIFTNVIADINAFVSLEAQAAIELPCSPQALIHSLHTMIASAMNAVHKLEQHPIITCDGN